MDAAVILNLNQQATKEAWKSFNMLFANVYLLMYVQLTLPKSNPLGLKK